MSEPDRRLFFRKILSNPLQIKAIAPSSRYLCQEMAAAIDDVTKPVVELGVGTGNITRAMIERGVPEQNLHLIEIDTDFVPILQGHFPSAHVHHMAAEEIGNLDVAPGAVVSGLPLLSMGQESQEAILGGAFERMGDQGQYIQFTYGPTPPVMREVREEFGLDYTISRIIFWNAPPARVFTFRKA